MSLRTKVKVGRITSLSEARYCAGMGCDLLGFPVGEDGLRPEQYRQMIEWVSGPELVLEVQHSRTLDIQYITDNYPGHYIGIGLAQVEWLSRTDLNFIVALSPKDWINLYGNLLGKSNVKFIELTNVGIGDASTVKAVASHFPTFVSIDSPDQLEDTLKLNVAGIALMGSDEEKPGLKDYGATADILEALEEA